MPRDREGTFEPRLIPKHARRFAAFDDKSLAVYARGMTCARSKHSQGHSAPSPRQAAAEALQSVLSVA